MALPPPKIPKKLNKEEYVKGEEYVLTPKRLYSDRARIREVLRHTFFYSRLRYRVLSKAKYRLKVKAHEQSSIKYLCAKCQYLFSRQQIEVDHIVEVAKNADNTSLHNYAISLVHQYYDEDNLQVLCKTCHRSKALK